MSIVSGSSLYNLMSGRNMQCCECIRGYSFHDFKGLIVSTRIILPVVDNGWLILVAQEVFVFYFFPFWLWKTSPMNWTMTT